MEKKQVLIVDMGSKTILRLREILEKCHTNSLIQSPDEANKWMQENTVKAVILAGGLQDVQEYKPIMPIGIFPPCSSQKRQSAVLGICYGMYRILQDDGGEINTILGHRRFCVQSEIYVSHLTARSIFQGTQFLQSVWLGDGSDDVKLLPMSFRPIALGMRTDRICAVQHITLPIFGVNFYPESEHTTHGVQILKNFLNIAGCESDC